MKLCRKEFVQHYASLLSGYNIQYLDLKDTRERLTQMLENLEGDQYQRGRNLAVTNHT